MGPLAGTRVVELAGIGPGPFCGMVLADLGAEVVQVHRAPGTTPSLDPLERGRLSVSLDLKRPEAVEVLLRLVESSDVLIEGFRPGVTERLGVGPDVCRARNPRLVYGRMTGWGQDGPYARYAGHDINYIALAGALEGLGRAGQPPTPPTNLVGDFGGGGMLLALGVVSALFERDRSGEGQVVDAAMVDGVALLMSFLYGMQAIGRWGPGRGKNYLDTGAARYDVYETADGKWVSIGANEPQFYSRLVRLLGVADDPDVAADVARPIGDVSVSPPAKEKLAAVFRTRTRSEWCELFEGDGELCFAPVLTMNEAPENPHLRARGTFAEIGGVVQAMPAPRFSRTPGSVRWAPPARGEHTDQVLARAGMTGDEIAALRSSGALG
jgi:alpha-methylacyl-CoA racemase